MYSEALVTENAQEFAKGGKENPGNLFKGKFIHP